MWRFVLIFLVVFCGFDSFYLLPWAKLPGVFNVSDPGLFLLIGAVLAGLLFFRRPERQMLLRQPAFWLVLVYLLMVLIQVALAAFNYRQSLLSGLIAVRHQFYYLALPLFFLLLRSIDDYQRLLNWLTYLSLVVFALALVNYFGKTLFTYKFAEGHHTRSGIVRAYIPGMILLGLSAVWETTKWINAERRDLVSGVRAWTLLGAHFFRQTRSQLVGLICVWLALMLVRRRYGLLFLSGVLFTLAAATAQVMMKENLLLSLFSSTFNEVENQEGTWEARLQQMQVVMQQFREHPLIGSGATVLRIAEDDKGATPGQTTAAEALAAIADLGYPSVLKGYGLLGLTWVIIFLLTLFVQAFHAYRQGDFQQRTLALFALGYLFFVMISGVTINYFMFPQGILMLSLITALLARLRWEQTRTQEAQNG
ncbi:MAG TPA: O-antigen ligase family protein [Pseudomonadales bacterium]|nr:O-antigen ligase family protein [Pseudomonadales bacterium]